MISVFASTLGRLPSNLLLVGGLRPPGFFLKPSTWSESILLRVSACRDDEENPDALEQVHQLKPGTDLLLISSTSMVFLRGNDRDPQQAIAAEAAADRIEAEFTIEDIVTLTRPLLMDICKSIYRHVYINL